VGAGAHHRGLTLCLVLEARGLAAIWLDGYSSNQGTTERNRTMTFWLFRKPRLYRILAPMEPQPRPAPRRVQYQFDRVGEQFDEADLAVARRAAPTEEEEERNRDGLAVPRSEGPRSTAVDVQ
jgi:hypothetical protein